MASKKTRTKAETELLKELAREKYLRGNFTQEEVAKAVGLSRQTINRMAQEEKWDERKAGLTLTREEIIKGLYRQAKELNDEIMKRPPGQRFPDNTELHKQTQLASNIKKLENEAGIAEIISVLTRFINYVRPIDLEKAKEITLLSDLFIRENV